MAHEIDDRTVFLEELLRDHAGGALAPMQVYVHRYPGISDFVRQEYQALMYPEPTEGRYTVESTLATGGMGEVWLARDRVLGRHVVLKMVRAEKRSAEAIARLQREARVLSRFDHPHICRILDVFEQDGSWILVLPYLQGETLAASIERTRSQNPLPACVELPRNPGQAPLPRALGWLATVAEAVHAAHEAGIVHRDLKPSNLWISTEGEPVVLDFGLAVDAGEQEQRLTRTGDRVGTPLYMAPEQIEGLPCDARTDIHALGVVLYEMLSMMRPFEGATREATFRQILAGEARHLRTKNQLISRDLEAVCLKAMEREPARRYATALEFAQDLRRVVRLEPTRARPPSAIKLAVRSARRHPVRVLAAIVVVLSLLLAADRVIAAREEQRQEEAADYFLREFHEHFDAGRIADAGKALDRSIDAVPINKPTGLVRRVNQSELYARHLNQPREAVKVLNHVLEELPKHEREWPASPCLPILRQEIMLADRPLAGSYEDVLGWALLRRGWFQMTLGDYESARADLFAATEMLRATDNFHRLTNAYQDLAEIGVLTGDRELERFLDLAEANYCEPRFNGTLGHERGYDWIGRYAMRLMRAHGQRLHGNMEAAMSGYRQYLERWVNAQGGAIDEEHALLARKREVVNLDYAHALLWYMECDMWLNGAASHNRFQRMASRYVMETYGGSADRGLQLHMAYVEMTDRWLDRHDARESLETADWVAAQADSGTGVPPSLFALEQFRSAVLRSAGAPGVSVEVVRRGNKQGAVLRTGSVVEHLSFPDPTLRVWELKQRIARWITDIGSRTNASPRWLVLAAPVHGGVRKELADRGWRVVSSLAACLPEKSR